MIQEFGSVVQQFIGLFGVVCWLCSPGWAFAPQSKPPDCCEPLWTVQVAESYESPILFQNIIKKPILHHHENAGIIFLDDDHLLVYGVELTRELSSRVSADISSAFRLHASLFDAVSGKLALTKDWGTRAHDSSIHITKGGVLVRAGEEIRFYSRTFEELQKLPLLQTDPNDTWVISVSPTGKTVLLNHYNRNESYFEVRDGITFELKNSWSQTPSLRRNLYSISDVAIAAADSHQEHILISDFGTRKWRILDSNSKGVCASPPTLVSDTLLVYDNCNKLTLLSIEGLILMSDHAEKHESVEGERIEAARDGRTIAASLVQGRGGGLSDTDVRRTGNRIAVYDLTLKKRLLTVEVVPLPTSEFDFALSPDGSKLAVLNDRRVSVYLVPTS